MTVGQDWPSTPGMRHPPFVTNIEEWVRRSGRVPSYASAAVAVAGTFTCPVEIRTPFTAKKLYCLNGAVVAGYVNMSLSKARRTSVTNPYTQVRATLVAQAGVNIWQEFDIPDTLLSAGPWFVSWTTSAATSQVQQLYAPATANGGEATYMGGILGSSTLSKVVPILAIGGVV